MENDVFYLNLKSIWFLHLFIFLYVLFMSRFVIGNSVLIIVFLDKTTDFKKHLFVKIQSNK